MRTERNKGLTPKQTRFITEYAKSDNLSESCRIAEINRSTGYKYLERPEIRYEIDKMRMDIVNTAWLKLSNNLEKAVDTVSEIIANPNTSINARLRATELIFSYTARYTDSRDIISRMERLEDSLNAK